MRRRAAAIAALGSILLPAAGCGSDEPTGEARLAVYLSAPATGPAAPQGRAIARGARDVLTEVRGEVAGIQVRVAVLDSGPGTEADPSPGGGAVRAAANARQAVEDSTAIAYIGELESSTTQTSLAITNEARLLQVSPLAAASYLTVSSAGSEGLPETQSSGVRTFGTLGELDASPRELGAEAMKLVLDAIDAAEDPLDRASVVEGFFALGERKTAGGTYEFDDTGVARTTGS